MVPSCGGEKRISQPRKQADRWKKETAEKLQSSIAKTQVQGFLWIGPAKSTGPKTRQYKTGEPRSFLVQGTLQWLRH
jgi:hypothetical protein